MRGAGVTGKKSTLLERGLPRGEKKRSEFYVTA